MPEKQIEFIVPKGYKKSNKSTDEKLVFEFIEEKNAKDEAKKFLLEIFNKMKVRVELNRLGHVYYDVDGMGTVFEQDFENTYLWVSYRNIWKILESHFPMNYNGIQLFIKSMVEETLGWKGLTPYVSCLHHLIRVGETLEWKGLTPRWRLYASDPMIE